MSNEIEVVEREKRDPSKKLDKYTLVYRIIKTCLLVFAWVSFGINNEIVGSTFEDLRILLNLNYEFISFGLVLRGFGYLIMILFSGFLYDKLSAYADLIMAISSFVFAMRKLINFLNKYSN